MIKSERIQKIIKAFKKYDLSAYEIAKETSLTQQGIDNIIKGKTEKPRNETLKVLEDYIGELYDDRPMIEILEESCIEHWEELKKRPFIAKHIKAEALTIVTKILIDKINDTDASDLLKELDIK